ncbi:MAG: glycerophosphodiester phosphodiesterase family protein [Pseudomonadales bacterium]
MAWALNQRQSFANRSTPRVANRCRLLVRRARHRPRLLSLFLVVTAAVAWQAAADGHQGVDLGTRPQALVADMDEGALKQALQQCRNGPFFRTRFSIGHRGAALRFPEHTRESYLAAARQGAGIIECDVTFTSDRQLVCRHSQCDLHTTTNILATDLASKCTRPFAPADPATGKPAGALCCASDITLAEFRQLCGRMDVSNPRATSVAEYLSAAPESTADAACGTLMTHAESISLFDSLGVDMTPELKAPEVPMPFGGDYTRERYAQQMIDEYRTAGIAPARVWPQSFDLADVLYWIGNDPAFGRQAVYLDGRFDDGSMLPGQPETFVPSMAALASQGVKIVAPPMWVLVTLDADGHIVPSAYAKAARAAGLDIITWTLERSGLLGSGGGYYYQSVADAIDNDGDTYRMLDVLARDVGVIGVFSDWPATVSYYASCMGLK